MNPISENPVTGPVRAWLRVEGLLVFVVATLFYRYRQMPWLLFLILFFTPDLAMLAYLVGARVGAAAYNSVHSYTLPLALLGLAILKNDPALLPYALIWIAHIGFDRTLGYGLKYNSAFGHTHLGWIGKQKTVEIDDQEPSAQVLL